MINKLFPILDHLYIFQLFEYNISDYLKWFAKYPFKRNLQRKHTFELTSKSLIILVLSLALQLALITGLMQFAQIQSDLFLALVTFLLLQQISPIFISLSQLILYPLENYKKQKIIKTAQLKINKLKDLKKIAIVGSFAKTSTKNILYTLLWKDFYTVKTPKSYNTQISVARTIVSDLKPSTQIFIAEMDAYHPGEIKALCDLVKPDLGIITAIAPQHLERFGNMEALAKAQFELADSLKERGTLIVNLDDKWSRDLEKEYQLSKIYLGGKKNDFYVSDINKTEKGLSFNLHTKKETAKIELPLKGKHHAYNFLAAATIAYQLGLPLKTIQKRAKLIQPTEHRLEIKNLGTITLVDNSYNTNPTASKAALDVLSSYKDHQKILITPGLVELGDQFKIENINFIKLAATVADDIIIVGENAKKELLEGLNQTNFPKNKLHLVNSTKEALALLPKITTKQSAVLLENDLPDQYF